MSILTEINVWFTSRKKLILLYRILKNLYRCCHLKKVKHSSSPMQYRLLLPKSKVGGGKTNMQDPWNTTPARKLTVLTHAEIMFHWYNMIRMTFRGSRRTQWVKVFSAWSLEPTRWRWEPTSQLPQTIFLIPHLYVPHKCRWVHARMYTQNKYLKKKI